MRIPLGAFQRNSYLVFALITAIPPLTSCWAQAQHANRGVTTEKATSISAAMESCLERLPELYQTASKSIVRVERTDTFHVTGVIVSTDGHILVGNGFASDDATIWGDSDMKVHLSDGRTVTATTAGWSLEWRFAVMKIKEVGPWPAIKIRTTKDLNAGEPCLVVGYLPRGDAQHDALPSARLGYVDRTVPTRWFATTANAGFFEAPAIIGMDGGLLGINTQEINAQSYATAIDQFVAYRDDLFGGKCLDWIRYPPPSKSIYRIGVGDDPERPFPSMRKTDEIVGEPKPPRQVSDAELAKVKEIAKDATVRLISKERLSFDGEHYERWSGVIVSEDGYILTCGHSEQFPGEQLTVQLSDGRDADAVALGTNPITDIGLVRMTTPGTWPFAEIAASSVLEPGDPLVAAGYPAINEEGQWTTQRTPKIGATAMRHSMYSLWHSQFDVLNDRFARGGMSGGGIFDQQGRYVAVFHGGTGTRSEIAKLQWDQLKRVDSIDTAIGLPHPLRNHFETPSKEIAESVLELLVDSKPVSIGVVIDADGWILTKASVLDGEVSCRINDQKIVVAKKRAELQEHDLALLKIDVAGLSAIEFSDVQPPSVTNALCAVGPRQMLKPGIVSVGTRAIPPETRWKGDSTEDAPGGVLISQSLDTTGTKLQHGDIIVSINNHATPNVAALMDVLRIDLAGYFAGDLISVALLRKGESRNILTALPRATGMRWQMAGHDNPRRAGFAAVFDTDIKLLQQEVGCPVIDADGHVRGIAIASRGRGESRNGPTSVLPSHVVRRMKRQLMDDANTN